MIRCANVVTLLLVLHISVMSYSEDIFDKPQLISLYEKAKEEGKAIIWGTDSREVDWIPQAVGERFPGIEVIVFGDLNSSTRLIAESRAGRNQVDIFWSSLSSSITVFERGLFDRVDWSLYGIQTGSTALEGTMAYTNNVVYTIVYKAGSGEKVRLPEKWSDLLDAEYHNKMAGTPFLMPRLVAALGQSWGREEAIRYSRKLRDDAGLLLTRVPLDQLLLSGEREYALGVLDQLPQQWKRNGAQLEYIIPEPVVVVQFGASVLSKSPHPNAARLIAAWLASPEGKLAREKATFAKDYRPGSPSPSVVALHKKGLEFIYDTTDQLKERNSLIAEVNSILLGQSE